MKLARTLLLIVAVLYILIGVLHLDVHYRILVPETAQNLMLIPDVDLGGLTGNVFKMWQGFSFMMGICFIIIGGLVISTLRALPEQYPPIATIMVMMLLLGSVVYSGYHFFSAPQFYGGLMGLTFLFVSLVLTVRSKNSKS